MPLLPFFHLVAKERLVAKITSMIVILGTGALIYVEPTIFNNNSVKEIALFILGGATAFLFAKD